MIFCDVTTLSSVAFKLGSRADRQRMELIRVARLPVTIELLGMVEHRKARPKGAVESDRETSVVRDSAAEALVLLKTDGSCH